MDPFIPQKLPIKDIEWEPLIPLIGKANRALAHYNGILRGIPNTEVLLAPLTTHEAVLSSKIEGTVATMGEVYKYEAGEEPQSESRKQDVLEIINYRKALYHAEKQLKGKPFNLNLLLKLHSILLDSVRGRDKGRGRFRRIQNWIGSPGSTIEQAEFIPPEPTVITEYLDNWEKYYHLERPDPLVQLAIVHAQFEIIHPFIDGNGRLGRILIPLFLYEKKLIDRPMFYLSGYFEKHRDEYVNRLRALGVDDGAWNKWIEFFLMALDTQAEKNANKAGEILKLYEDMKGRVIELTHSQYAIPLLDGLFKWPVFHSTRLDIAAKPRPNRQLVSALLRKLREAGMLKVLTEASGRRPQVLAFAELINLCEEKQVI